MGNFNASWLKTYRNEGNYSSNPLDHGGETYKGIASKYWKDWNGWPIIHNIIAKNPSVTVSALNRLLEANTYLQLSVSDFYKANFWDVLGLSNINDQQVCDNLFDCGVNEGTGKAAGFLQQAINHVINVPGNPCTLVAVDNRVGPTTIKYANTLNAEALYDEINTLRHDHYLSIIASHPDQVVFKNAWLSRLGHYKIS